ncbi:MAG: CoA transferase [Geminicoccaceae bacterium]|jgi:crotonobetainyl-CoA:carnitine CoA-transferase CaiB-like acyl-CoA transferase|nr:CoA transferase [Thermomicrobiales bacterium]MDF3053169.1 CoA transferase [Geminicoccaceae bacterium]
MADPLAGLRVLDLGRYIAAPYCAMVLGDFGADVVKVERPGGEDVRRQLPLVDGDSTYALVYNRSKRGLTLDARHPRGRELLRALALKADVVLENFRPGVMAKLGCEYESLRAENPRVIVASISGFGQDGPYAQKPAFDSIAQAMSGLMSLTGERDGPPLLNGTFIADYVTALYTVSGILLAVRERDQTGEGQHVDVALLDSAVSLLTTAIPDFLLAGRALGRTGARDRARAPVNAYPAQNGSVFISAVTQEQFGGLLRAIGRGDLCADPRFATADARHANAEPLDAVVAAWTAERPVSEIVTLLQREEVPCTPVAEIADVVANPQLRHRAMIVELERPSGARIPMAGQPIRLSRTPASLTRAAPEAGQHSREVLHDWLGLDDVCIDALGSEGVI